MTLSTPPATSSIRSDHQQGPTNVLNVPPEVQSVVEFVRIVPFIFFLFFLFGNTTTTAALPFTATARLVQIILVTSINTHVEICKGTILSCKCCNIILEFSQALPPMRGQKLGAFILKSTLILATPPPVWFTKCDTIRSNFDIMGVRILVL